MTDIFELCPQPGASRVPWDAIHQAFPWIRKLQGCPQTPRYHAEGDVYVHTRMVCEALIGLDAWQAQPRRLQEDLFAAALLHDAAKPECTKLQENGRITSRGHARRGALLARRILWHQRVPTERREHICALVRHHMVPLYLRDSAHHERQVLTISQSLRCDLLAILGQADALGRVCEDPEDLQNRHRAFESICRALGCFERPYRFGSEPGRFHYSYQLTDDPQALIPEPRSEAVLMCGLPGSGKRRWVESNLPHLPRLDVDEIRHRLGIHWRDNQGAVISAARGQARSLLGDGESFVWLDMNLNRQLREQLIRLIAEHRVAVRIVYMEGRPEDLEPHLGPGDRRSADLGLLMDQWDVPDISEAYRLDVVPAAQEVACLSA